MKKIISWEDDIQGTRDAVGFSKAYSWILPDGTSTRNVPGKGILIIREDYERYSFTSRINYSGNAMATFVILDDKGAPLKNTEVFYKCYNSLVKTSVISDEYGVIQIVANETPITYNPIGKYPIYYSSPLWIKNDSGEFVELAAELLIEITVTPATYTQSWSGTLNLNGVITEGPTVGATTGPAKVQATLAEVGANGTMGGSLSITDRHKADGRDLELKQSYKVRAGVSGSAGPGLKAEIMNSSVKIDGINMKASADLGMQSSAGLNIYDYDPANTSQKLLMSIFLYDSIASGSGNIQDAIVANVLKAAMREEYKDYYDFSLNASGSGGIDALQAKVNQKDPSAKTIGVTALVLSDGISAQYKKKVDYQNNYTFSFGETSSAKVSLGKVSVPYTSFTLLSAKGGNILNDYSVSTKRVRNTNTNRWGDVSSVSYTYYKEKEGGSLFYYNGDKSISTTVSYDANGSKSIASSSSLIDGFSKGEKFIINSEDIISEIESVQNAQSTFTSTTETNALVDIPFNLGVKAGLGGEIGYGLSSEYRICAETESGTNNYSSVLDSRLMATTAQSDPSAVVQVASPVTGVSAFTELIKEPMVVLNDRIKSIITTTKDTITNGVSTAKAEINTAKKTVSDTAKRWIVQITTVITGSKVDELGSFEAFTYDLTDMSDEEIEELGEDENAGEIKCSIGVPVTVNVFESDAENASEVSSFGEDTLLLTLSYDEEDFTAAGVSVGAANELAIYRYSETLLGYTYVGGTVDTEAMKVTAEINEPGQYVLMINTMAPYVISVSVEDNTSTPKISVAMSDWAGLKDFRMTLDGTEVVNKASANTKYNAESGSVEYKVTSPLAVGTHTITINASDNAGNTMAQPYEYEFSISEEDYAGGNNPGGGDNPGEGDNPGGGDNPAGGTEKNTTVIVASTSASDTPDKTAKGSFAVDLKKTEYTYTGYEIMPEPVVSYKYQEYNNGALMSKVNTQKLIRNVDYTLDYKDNINTGKAEIVITGIGNYSGAINYPFYITKKNAKALTLEPIADMAGDYEENTLVIRDSVVVKDGLLTVSPSDYTTNITSLTDKKGNRYAVVSITPTENGNYSGNAVKAKANVLFLNPEGKTNASTFTLSLKNSKVITYNGKVQKPAITVTDSDGKKVKTSDYKLVYSNNINAGTATVVAVGKKNSYGKSTPLSFTINPGNFNKVKISAISRMMYQKSISGINPVVKDGSKVLKKDVDYRVMTDSIEKVNLFGAKSSKLTVTIQNLSDNFTKNATKTTTLTITKRNLTSRLYCGITVDTSDKASNKTPAVTVTYNGEILTMAENKYATVGDYYITINEKKKTIKISGIGNYTGVRNVKF